MAHEGMFKHQCIHPECEQLVGFDDEPWCFTHSPDEGSSLAGWSARRALHDSAEQRVMELNQSRPARSNVFDNKTEER